MPFGNKNERYFAEYPNANPIIKIPLADILLRAKVLAHVKEYELQNWVSYELDEYPKSESRPASNINIESVGTFT